MFGKKILSCLLFSTITIGSLSAQDIASGIKLIKNERYNQAKQYFSSLLNSNSRADADFYLGQIYFLSGKLDSAKTFYSNGIQADNENPLNYAGMVKIDLAENNQAAADKNQNEAIDINERMPQVYLTLAEAYSQQKVKNYDKSIELLNNALKTDPKYADALLSLGNVFLSKNNGTEAIKNFQKVIDNNPDNPEALTLKASVYILINNYDDAVPLLQHAVTADSTYSPAYHSLAELYANLKDYAKAAEYFSEYIDKSEKTPDNQRRFAAILYLNKQYSEAIEILKDIIKTEPDNPIAIRTLAYSYLRLGETENSMQYFQKLFDMPSVDYLSSDYENYADLLDKTDNDSLAVLYLNKAVDADTTRKDLLGKISVLQFKNKKWAGVISALERKKTLTAQEYFDLGKAYYFTQNYPKADSAFSLLSAKVPDLAIAYFWQARVKTNFDPESDSGLAKPYYEQFINVSKEDTARYKTELIEAYSYLGYLSYLRQDNDTSRMYWQKVYALDPTNKQAIEALKNIK